MAPNSSAANKLNLDGTARLVDLGAGTGQVVRALRPFFARAIAVDAEPDMVAFGRRQTEREGDGIDWRLSRVGDLDLPAGSADVVASGNAFHRFDRPAVVMKAAEWLAEHGAIVLLWSDGVLAGKLSPEPWQAQLSNVVDRWLARSGAGERIPAGWERKEYTDEVVLSDAGFDRQVERTIVRQHRWSTPFSDSCARRPLRRGRRCATTSNVLKQASATSCSTLTRAVPMNRRSGSGLGLLDGSEHRPDN
jgi:SAM-dependent methyltransferase